MEMTNKQAIYNLKQAKCIPHKHETLTYVIQLLQEQEEDPYQTGMDEAWKRLKAMYSLCNRCIKQPNCDDGKRNLYMNECSRFVDIVEIPQTDGEKICDTCRNNDTYHCVECENKSDYEQAQADDDLTTALCSLPKIQSSDGQDYVQLYDVLETVRRYKLGMAISNKTELKHWIHRNDDYNDWLECPSCGYGSDGEVKFGEGTLFCPYCGERLEEK